MRNVVMENDTSSNAMMETTITSMDVHLTVMWKSGIPVEEGLQTQGMSVPLQLPIKLKSLKLDRLICSEKSSPM